MQLQKATNTMGELSTFRGLLQGTPHLTGIFDEVMKQHSVFAPKRVEAMQLLGMMHSMTDLADMLNHMDKVKALVGESQRRILGFKTLGP